jgi:hypothetical protein
MGGRRPVLAMIAIAINLVAYLGGAMLAVVEVLYLASARSQSGSKPAPAHRRS